MISPKHARTNTPLLIRLKQLPKVNVDVPEVSTMRDCWIYSIPRGTANEQNRQNLELKTKSIAKRPIPYS